MFLEHETPKIIIDDFKNMEELTSNNKISPFGEGIKNNNSSSKKKEVCFKEPSFRIKINDNEEEEPKVRVSAPKETNIFSKKKKMTINKNLLIPPSAEKASLALSHSKKIIHEQNLNDIDLILKQFNNIGYENALESDDDDVNDETDLNESLEIPIEEKEPKFETESLEKILAYFEVL